MNEDQVKQLVTQEFHKLGTPPALKVRETLFIDGGKRLATAYQTNELHAVWCVEDGTVVFRSSDGRVLRTITLPKDKTAALAA